MTLEFYQTVMGKEFYDRTVPRIAKSLERIADQLEADAKERNVTELKKPLWEDNELQFARLLCELVANWPDDASAKQVIEETAASMDLGIDDVQSLFDRAEDVWEEAKQRVGKRQAMER